LINTSYPRIVHLHGAAGFGAAGIVGWGPGVATFLLVQPAWLGGWCWDKVAMRLRACGHDVYAPTLTGLGERAHLTRPDVGLATHIDDVVSVAEFDDLDDVILVGTSSGGTVITGVANRIPGRIADPALTLTGPIPRASTSGERKALELSGERSKLRMSRSLHVTFMLAG
jgi:pimeloyl-ACP methyl ester carboxylesterase